MQHQGAQRWSRRELLGGLTLAGTAGLLGLRPRSVAAEPPPETTKLTLVQISGLCGARR
jgi:NitT/TauT family transport system substrate-binding protein